MSEESPSLEALLAKANSLLASQAVTPQHIEKAHRYPYYREHFADEILDIVNTVIATRSPIIIGLASGSMHTLYQKWRQAVNYIHDHAHKYPADTLKKLDHIQVRRLPGVGLKFIPGAAIFALAAPLDWKGDFQTFINTAAVGDVFERMGVIITAADKAWCYSVIKPVIQLFAMSIGKDSIKIVRLQ